MNKFFRLHTLMCILSATMLLGCGKLTDNRIRPSATGSIYECLVVIPNQALTDDQLIGVFLSQFGAPGSAYNDTIATLSDLVEAVMEADMPCMPQMEPYFNVSHITNAAFDDLLKPSRNILMVDIDSVRYSSLKVKVATDYWSHPQAVYTIQAPSSDDFVIYWLNHGPEVRDWFVRRELDRQASFYRASTNKGARSALRASMHCDMLISDDYMLIADTTLLADQATLTDDEVRLIWCCNNKGSMRRDILVYSYPYTDPATFTQAYLCDRRDAILSRVVSADVEGTYMGTEMDIFPPQMRSITVQHNQYAAELRGLWKMRGGEAMGGPFVSLTRLDATTNRVVTAEAFVFGPGQRKRNELRKAEAMLYTLTLPQDTID